MPSTTIRFFITLCFILLCASCVSKKKYVDALNQRDTYKTGRDNAENSIKQLEKRLDQLRGDTVSLGRSMRECKQRYNNLLKGSSQTTEGLYNQISEQNKELNSLRNELETSKSTIRKKEQQLAEKQTELTDRETTMKERGEVVEALRTLIHEETVAKEAVLVNLQQAMSGFSAEDLKMEQKNGQLSITMADKFLFKLGDTQINVAGKQALIRLTEVLKLNPDIDIMIEGHTDNVPVKTVMFKDNWDLSVLRATAIARVLVENGVAPNRILPAGRGEYAPLADNTSLENRAKNRRTEIILLPNLKEIYQLLENK